MYENDDDEEIGTVQFVMRLDEHQLESWWNRLDQDQQEQMSGLIQAAIENLEMESRLDEYLECAVMVEVPTVH